MNLPDFYTDFYLHKNERRRILVTSTLLKQDYSTKTTGKY